MLLSPRQAAVHNFNLYIKLQHPPAVDSTCSH